MRGFAARVLFAKTLYHEVGHHVDRAMRRPLASEGYAQSLADAYAERWLVKYYPILPLLFRMEKPKASGNEAGTGRSRRPSQ